MWEMVVEIVKRFAKEVIGKNLGYMLENKQTWW